MRPCLEVISHQYYNHKCDVFSYGIMLWELVSGGDIPYPGYTPLQAGAYTRQLLSST